MRDAADFSRRHDHGVGANPSNPSLSLRLPGEVERRPIRRKDGASLRFESAHESGADHTSVACDVNAVGGEVEQRRFVRN